MTITLDTALETLKYFVKSEEVKKLTDNLEETLIKKLEN